MSSEELVQQHLLRCIGKQSLGELQTSINQLREQGKSWEWLETALSYNSYVIWQRYGFGSLFKGKAKEHADKKKNITTVLNE